jgi:hypothetical protein
MDWNRVQQQQMSGEDHTFTRGVLEGVWDGAKDMASGIADIVNAGYKASTDETYRDQLFSTAADVAQATKQFGAAAYKDPLGTGESAWDKSKALAGQAKDAFLKARAEAEQNGTLGHFYGTLVGRGAFELIPISKLGLVAKGAKGAAAAAKVSKASATVSRTSRKAKKLTKAQRLARQERKLRAASKNPVGTVVTCEKASSSRLRGLHKRYAQQIRDYETFRTHGVGKKAAQHFMTTPAGKRYLEALQRADPKAPEHVIHARFYEQVTSGKNLPQPVTVTEDLVKIVPTGQFKDYTPFWTTQAELDKAIASGKPLNQVFGLPMNSDAVMYDVYKAKPPPGGAEVFRSRIAETSELGGLEKRPGGAIQYVRPDGGGWTHEKMGYQLPNIGGKAK